MGNLSAYSQEIKEERLLTAQINLLNACNSRCKYCRKYEWKRDVLRLETVESALKAMKASGLKTVSFSGGEPILHPYIEKIIKYCISNNIKYSISTSLEIENKRLLELLVDTAQEIFVSVDSPDAVENKHIRNTEFEHIAMTMKNLEYISLIRKVTDKPRVCIAMAISKYNHESTYLMYKYARKIGCNLKMYLVDTWEELKLDKSERNLFHKRMLAIAKNEKECKSRITNAIEFVNKYYAFENPLDEIKLCSIPKFSCVVDASGDVYPCSQLLNENGLLTQQDKYSYGNINGKSAEEIKSILDKRHEVLYPISQTGCKICKDRYTCMFKELGAITKKPPLFI